MISFQHLSLLLLLPCSPWAIASTLPRRSAAPAAAGEQKPLITPSPVSWDPTRTDKVRRDIADAIKSKADEVVGDVLSELGKVPAYVASGVPNFFQDLPGPDKVQSELGIDDDQIAALPNQVLNIPGYGNWTDQGWNLRFHGNVYKQPQIEQSKLDDLANIFLIDTSVEELPPDQAAQARNFTASIFVLQQDNVNVTFDLRPAPSAGSSGEPGGGGAVPPPGGSQQVKFPDPTTEEGDFDAFVQIENNGLTPGNATQRVQRLNVYTEGSDIGNATAYLVPSSGITVISDIDDILRVTKIYKPKEGLLNSFARPFTPWMNMPDIYANWSRSIPDIHFHYLTTTPEQVTRNYMEFIYKTYPGGSFDTRPLNFSDVSATLSIRNFLLRKIFATYPDRKFVLVADTSNSDVMRDYPKLAVDFPRQVQCIFLRNTTWTDKDDRFPYDTSGFETLNEQIYMFFHVPDDLANLNIAAGQCVNTTVIQNVTFGLQGLPFGINLGDGKKAGAAAAIVPRFTPWVVLGMAGAAVMSLV